MVNFVRLAKIGIKMEKYLYVQGFCKETHYMGLQPAAYIREEQEPFYVKSHMACDCAGGECKMSRTCDLLKDAPDVIEPEKEWRLREKMKGTKLL